MYAAMIGRLAVVVCLFLCLSPSLCVHVQNDQLLRRRVSLREIDRDSSPAAVEHFRSVQRRDVTNSSTATPSPTPPPVIRHFARLQHDRHRLAIVHWSGDNSTAIFMLTTNRDPSGTSYASNLWRSTDYGKNFTNDNTKVNGTILDYYYISPHDKMKLIFVAKTARMLYVTVDEGDSYSGVKVPFVADDIDYNPFESRGTYLIAYDKAQKALYVSTDLAKTWTPVDFNVTRYYWEVLPNEDTSHLYFEKLHESGSKVFVASAPYQPGDIREFQPDSSRPHFNQRAMVLAYEYIISQVTDAGGSATLYVSHNRGPFVAAQFPFRSHLLERDYLLVDGSEGQMFVAVNHRSNLTSLYTSEAKGISYSLTLKDVVTTSDSTWASDTATVQLYRVRGVKGTYFVNQHQLDRTPWTLVSFDKGARWLTVPAPSVDNNGRDTNCYQPNCSLQLDVRRMSSRDSTVGIVWAQGNVGKSKTSRNQGSFISRDGGLTWRWVFNAYYLASFADHGAVLASAPRNYRITNQVEHSCDEGTTWRSLTMPKSIYVIGLFTEPGERSLIISIFGFERHWVEWLVGQLDFKDIAKDPCRASDYYKWIPTDERIGRRCLLGESLVYKRRKADVCCYNGYDYEVPTSSSVCGCASEDFECDFGYERDHLDSPCRPSSGTPTEGPPDNCPEGQSYNETRGYRKVAGDVCQGGEDTVFMYRSLSCPIDPPSGLSISSHPGIVGPGQVVTFALKQTSGGTLTTKYTWSFDDGRTFVANYTTSQTVTHSFVKSKKGPYLVSVVAVNPGGQDSAIRPIVVYDKIVSSAVSVTPPKVVVENVAATFTVNLDRSQNQSYGSIRYTWLPGDGSTPQNSDHPVFTYTYSNAGVYNASVVITTFLQKTVSYSYQVTVASGPGGLLLAAVPTRVAPLQKVTFTLNQTVGTTKETTAYTWRFGDGQVTTVNSFSESHTVSHTYARAREQPYEVTVTANSGFASIATTTYVVVNDPITSAQMHLPTKPIENENATFSVILDTSKIYGTIQYTWSMGDEVQRTTKVPLLNYEYQQGGRYRASVSLSNSLPSTTPYTLHFSVDVESETLVAVQIHVPSNLIAIEHEYSFSVTATARSKSGIVNYQGILDCYWDTAGYYEDYFIPGTVIRHSYTSDNLGQVTVIVYCNNGAETASVQGNATITVVAPTKKVLLTGVSGLLNLLPANASNEMIKAVTTEFQKMVAVTSHVNPLQLLVTLHPEDHSVEVIVLPQSNSANDVSLAESVAEQLPVDISGTSFDLTVGGKSSEVTIGKASVVKVHESSVTKGKSTVYVAVGVGVGATALVVLLVLGLYYYRRKYGQLEVAYSQLRETGRGNYEFSGGAETVGEEEESEHREHPAKGGVSAVQMSKIDDEFFN